MLNKGARMQVPVLVSRSSPTDMAVEMAKARGLTLIGYAHSEQIHVYSGQERVNLDEHPRKNLSLEIGPATSS
jgi:FdhD protein